MIKDTKIKLMKKKYQAILLSAFLLIIGILMVILSHIVLPEKFFSDGYAIGALIDSATSLIAFDSFNTTALVYRKIGFISNTNLLLEGIIVFVVSFVASFKSIKLLRLNNIYLFIFFFGWVILMSIYLGQLSKEFLAILVFSFLLTLSQLNHRLFMPLLILIFLIVSYYFRIYYVIILGLIILFYIADTFESQKFRILFIAFGILTLFLLANFKGIYLTEARTTVNIYRLGSLNAQSIISNPLQNSSIFTDLFNAIYAFLNLLLPVSLILKFQIRYLIFILWELINIILFLKIVKYTKYMKLHVRERKQVKFSIYLIVAFTMTQALFEPDYGSFLKHQLDLLPVFLYIVAIYFFNHQRLRK